MKKDFDQVLEQVWDQPSNPIRTRLDYKVWASIGDQVLEQVAYQVSDQVRSVSW